jgi:hypothetical protein
MSPLVRKEIRLLLPFLGIALLLAVAPFLIVPRPYTNEGIVEIFFWFAMMLLGLAPFGQEFSLGTFSTLLAQPFERHRIWRIKIILTVLAGLLVFAVFAFCVYARLVFNSGDPSLYAFTHSFDATGATFADEFRSVSEKGLVLLAVAITGGFWTTLLFRQTGAALWFVILIPGVLFVVVEAIVHALGSESANSVIVSVLLLYSAAGFLWARRMFANAQDSQWLGENVALLTLSPAKPQTDSVVSRRTGAFRTLARKEFQSHQIGLLIGFGILVLHLITLAYRKFGTFAPNSELRFATESVPLLWLLVPWLLGSVTIAEERKQGTMESQLCLPVTRRLQFATKFSVALLLGIALGGIMPWLIEYVGSLFHIRTNFVGTTQAVDQSTVSTSLFDLGMYFGIYRGFVLICAGAAFITVMSFFASSLTRNTLHALGAAICLGVGLFILFQLLLQEADSYGYSLWKGPLIFLIGVPVAFIAVVWLSFSNYKRLHAGRNVWLRNLLILGASLFCAGIATAVIYQRPWEMAISLEPRHGPRQLTGPIRPSISFPGGRLFALLPDGRVWAGVGQTPINLSRSESTWNPQTQSFEWKRVGTYLPTNGVFVGGSNWVSLAANGSSGEVAGLQSDGSLWKIVAWQDRTNSSSRFRWLNVVPRPRRITSENDWKTVVVQVGNFVALKTNGTIWGWGNNDNEQFAPEAGKKIAEPVQIGTNSDWAEIFSSQDGPMLMKRNGSIWMWMEHNKLFQLNEVYQNQKDWLAVAGSHWDLLVLRRNGTLWASSSRWRALSFGFGYGSASTDGFKRVSRRSDFVQISGDNQLFVAITKDGSLVRSDTELFAGSLGQPSRYSDWLTANRWFGLLALADDGTICFWDDLDIWGGGGLLLAPSRRPLWSLNILAASKN